MEKNLYQKINEVKKVVKSFSKDASTKGHGAYKYVSGSQILKEIKYKMEEIGLLFLPVETKHREWTTYDYKTSTGREMTDFIVTGAIKYIWVNVDNPKEIQEVAWDYYGQQGDISKAFGSALTYSERYLLLKSLGVPTDEDDPDAFTEDKVKVNYVTKYQLSEFERLGVNIDGVLKTFKIDTIESLTKENADYVIKLKKKELDKKGQVIEVDLNEQNEKLEEINAPKEVDVTEQSKSLEDIKKD